MQKNRIQSALIQHCSNLAHSHSHLPQPTALIQHLYPIHWWNICYPTMYAMRTRIISYLGALIVRINVGYGCLKVFYFRDVLIERGGSCNQIAFNTTFTCTSESRKTAFANGRFNHLPRATADRTARHRTGTRAHLCIKWVTLRNDYLNVIVCRWPPINPRVMISPA